MQGVLANLCLSTRRALEEFCTGDPEVPDGTSLRCSLHHLPPGDLSNSCVSPGEGKGVEIEVWSPCV